MKQRTDIRVSLKKTPKENCKISNIEVRPPLEGMISSNSKQVEANTDTDQIILYC